jgi:hypothetical protein
MLIELYCEVFREKKIEFHEGLNVVQGDSIATNSIGKSTFLMIIDFIFGGSSFLKHNTDVIEQLGDHDYKWVLKFDNELFNFRRFTNNPDQVFLCSNNFEIKDSWETKQYTEFLIKKYQLNETISSFRQVVGPYSRIWPKDNVTNISRPLNSVSQEKASVAIINLIKLFNKYQSIQNAEKEIKTNTDYVATINSAFSKEIIPKINAINYRENLQTITKLESEIQNIKFELSKSSLDVNTILSKEILELQKQKDSLISAKFIIENRLIRVIKNLENPTSKVAKSNLVAFKNFFPEANIPAIEEIEKFHYDISIALKNKLSNSRSNLEQNIKQLATEILDIDNKTENLLYGIKNKDTSKVIDRVLDLNERIEKTSLANHYYSSFTESRKKISEIKYSLNAERNLILESITSSINDKIKQIIDRVYTKDHKIPKISFTEKNYKYEIVQDTGTGTTYSNLIIFDLAILRITQLPIVIHDSILFKNIENHAISEFIKLYMLFEKQVFISIDEIEKYGTDSVKRLNQSTVLRLDDLNVLYIKDWRKVT